MNDEKQSLITTQKVAERLGVSGQWVLKRFHEGTIPGFRIGGDGPLRFDPLELESWIRTGRPVTSGSVDSPELGGEGHQRDALEAA
jgi:excisionase family DNA binding protein